MSSIGGLLGTAGGAGGTGFASPQQAAIQAPVTTDQATDAYKSNQTALLQQQALLDAIKQQNGLQNQSQVYNQLSDISQGKGPNPAQAMLNQATGQNVANQAALMAGQRGSNANAGLIARQAAMQGANTQQQAAGQGATMQAQQSMNAMQGMGNLANTQAANQIGATGGVTSAQQAEQANLLNAIAGQNNARVGMQSNVNNVNGQLANTQLQGQQAMMGGMMQGLGSGLSSIMGAEGGEVNTDDIQKPDQSASAIDTPQQPVEAAPAPEQAADFGSFNSKVDAGTAPNGNTPTFGADSGAAALASGMSGMMGGGGKSGGGGAGGIMKMIPMLAALNKGGPVQRYAEGTPPGDTIQPAMNTNPAPAPTGPTSGFGKFLKGAVNSPKKGPDTGSMQPETSSSALFKGSAALFGSPFKGQPNQDNQNERNNPDMDSRYLHADMELDDAAKAAGQNWTPGVTPSADPLDQWGTRPEQTAPATNNDYSVMAAEGGAVPAMVSPGERYLSPKDVQNVKSGANPMQVGEKIPGKPKVSGAKNSYANDVVPKTLQEGGIVLPRSVTQSKNPDWAAHKFVREVMRKQKAKKK